MHTPITATLTELRSELQRGAIDPGAWVESVLASIEHEQSRINAFIRVDHDGARQAANESKQRFVNGKPRRLEGIPVAVKDNLDMAGMPTTAGMATRREHRAQADSAVVARLRAAGAVIVGKLNMNEAALGADGRNLHFGDCRNPLDPDCSPGGSSSGSAAAVAAGLVAAAIGTDTMGSVRIPAAYCGVWGFKPGTGRVSTRGSVAVSRRLDHVGPLARSAGDLAIIDEVISGPDPLCPVSMPVAQSAPEIDQRPVVGLLPLDPESMAAEVAGAYRYACDKLRAAGYRLQPLTALRLDPGRIRRAGLLVCEAELLIEHERHWQERREDFSDELAGLMRWAEGKPATELVRSHRLLDQVRMEMSKHLQQCNLLLLPTTPQCAFRLDEPTPASQADYTCLANAAGLPAVSFPASAGAGGLPVGLQLIAGAGHDRWLLQQAGLIEETIS